VVTPASLRAIAEIAQRHNLVIISDEIYEKYVYAPAQQLSVASLPGMYERTITLGGFSKTYAMTGWRVGYVSAPRDFIAHLAALKKATTGPISAVSQWAALAAATGPQEIVEEYKAIYDRRRRLMMSGLTDLGFTYGETQGAFFVYTNAASSGIPAFELSYLLLKEGHVLIFPGTAFGDKWVDWLRISLLQPQDQLSIALERMGGVLARHR
jgi:aspartate/methionine/tyrosine aminotransferase